MTTFVQDATIEWELKKDPFLHSLKRSLLLFWIAFRFAIFASLGTTVLIALWIANPLHCAFVFCIFWIALTCLFLVIGIVGWFVPVHILLDGEGIKYTGNHDRLYCWEDIKEMTIETTHEGKNIIAYTWQGRKQQRIIPVPNNIDLNVIQRIVERKRGLVQF